MDGPALVELPTTTIVVPDEFNLTVHIESTAKAAELVLAARCIRGTAPMGPD